mgnify:CR=1 FL=1
MLKVVASGSPVMNRLDSLSLFSVTLKELTIFRIYKLGLPIGKYLVRKRLGTQQHLVVIDFRKRFRYVITRRRILRH